jgi:hypothetical protein
MSQFLNSGRLAVTPSVSAGDLVPVFVQNSGITMSAAISTIASFIQTLLTSASTFITFYSVPLTGAVIPDNGATYNKWYIYQPAGTIAALTQTFPPYGTAVDQQEIALTSTQTITTLTLLAVGSTIIGANAGLSATTPINFKYNQPLNVWFRFGS